MMNWFVIHTKPRFEKKVEERLLSFGIEAYCPTRKEIRLWSDRKKKVDAPVLPSMVLVKLDEKKVNDVFNVAISLVLLAMLVVFVAISLVD